MRNKAYILFILLKKIPKCLARYIIEKFVKIPSANEIKILNMCEIDFFYEEYKDSFIMETYLSYILRKQKKFKLDIQKHFYVRQKTKSEILDQLIEKKKYYEKFDFQEYLKNIL